MIVIDKVSKVFRIPHQTTKTLFHRIVSFSQKRYRYEELFALRNVSFRVSDGEFVGIIGRNGSGKSSLLRTIAGIYRPTSGTVTVRDEISPLLELGLGFNSDFSCRDNIFVYGAILGFSRKEMRARLDEILAFAELERFIDTKLENLSSGMRMRLAFAIAIQSVAPILLVDEILAVGDKVFSEKCREVFMSFKREGKTIIYVSHDTESVRRFCDRVIVLNDGKLIGDGSPEMMIALYNQNLHHSFQLGEVG
jgi:ABC-type polysaccharide/polyol phosphate transport system ATPase subunit